jgi:hypothetical protein
LEFRIGNEIFSGENMSATLQVGQSVSAVASHPIIGDGTPSSAVLSNVSLSTGDVNVFTVSADPNVENGFIVVSVNPGSAQITGTATATELDGTTHQIPLTPDTITVIVAPPPPPPPATSFGLVFGTPTATT